MKLPEDKKERTKVLGLMAIGVGATIYVLARYAVVPIIKANKENAERITAVRDILQKADAEVKLIHRDREANEQAMAEIKRVSDNHLLHPSMGINYQIPASEVIDSIEKKCDFSLGTPMATMGGLIPGTSLPANRDLKSFSMGVGVDCSFATFVRLIRAIKAENPYIVLSRVSVSAQAKTPEQHRAGFTMSWPIWSDPKMVDTIKEQSKEKEPAGGKTP